MSHNMEQNSFCFNSMTNSNWFLYLQNKIDDFMSDEKITQVLVGFYMRTIDPVFWRWRTVCTLWVHPNEMKPQIDPMQGKKRFSPLKQENVSELRKLWKKVKNFIRLSWNDWNSRWLWGKVAKLNLSRHIWYKCWSRTLMQCNAKNFRKRQQLKGR